MKYIKKFNESKEDFDEDDLDTRLLSEINQRKDVIKDHLTDVFDIHDVRIEIYSKREYLETEEVKSGRLNANMSNFLKGSNFIVKVNLKSNPYKWSNESGWPARVTYSLDGAINANKHNYELLNTIKHGLAVLDYNYIFYIKDEYVCYFFIE